MATTTTRMKFVRDRKRREEGGASYLLCECMCVCARVYMCVCVCCPCGYGYPTARTGALDRRPALQHPQSQNTQMCSEFLTVTLLSTVTATGSTPALLFTFSKTSPAGMRILS